MNASNPSQNLNQKEKNQMKLTWIKRKNDEVLVDKNGMVKARVEMKDEQSFIAYIEGVLHGEFISQPQAKEYIEHYIKH
jgi:hypothetical protein